MKTKRPKNASKPIKLLDFDVVQEKIFRSHPRARELWEQTEPKRKIGLMLARLRKVAGLSQMALAKNAGWDKAFVSRLEGAQGGMPDTDTISRYAAGCGAVAGVVFGTTNPSRFHIVDAMTLHPNVMGRGRKSVLSNPFERLRNEDIALPTARAKGQETA